MSQKNDFAPIAALDLDAIKVKLMHEEFGEGWSRAYADTIEFEYRRFLYLVKKFPTEQAAPLIDIDIFWHYHILDTMKYAADCKQIFGYFLHHCPSTATQQEDAKTVHGRSGARMRKLYEATFGEACLRHQEGNLATASSAESAWCSPAVVQTAWCSPAMAKTASCSPAKGETAWCSPAANITEPKPAASNDRMWS
jgi:hypothetical protein